MTNIVVIMDNLIEAAEDLGIEIEWISMGPKLMKLFALELSGITMNTLDETDFSQVAKYRGIPLRQTEVEALNVKYLIMEEFWGELN